MENIERRIRRAARAMTRREVIIKAIARQLSWVQAAEVLGITARHMRRIRRTIERYGMEALMDHRGGRPRRRRIKVGTVALLIRLKRDIYPDFSVQHFYEQVTEQHRVKVSYNWLRLMLQEAEVVQQEPARGKYRRRRERRPMVGMLVHLAPRPMSGSRVCRCRTWWWRSTTPTAAFCTRGSLRRKARPRPSPRWSRWCATTAVNAGAKVHQWAGMKMHQFQGLWESWFDFWQGGARGGFPPRYCSQYLMSSRSERSSLIRILAALDRHRRGACCV